MCFGVYPYPAKDLQELTYKVNRLPLSFPSGIAGPLLDLVGIIQGLMQKDPSKRTTAAALASAMCTDEEVIYLLLLRFILELTFVASALSARRTQEKLWTTWTSISVMRWRPRVSHSKAAKRTRLRYVPPLPFHLLLYVLSSVPLPISTLY